MGDIGKLAISVVGGFVGNLLGSLFAPISKQEGPRLDDLSLPKSDYGKSIPKIYGNVKVTGNLMWGRPLKEKTEKISSGTFKASVEQTKYYYYGIAAWLLCEGPVTLKKVWANGKLLYNADSSTGQSAAGSETWSKYFTFFDGTQTTPSGIMESYEGVGRVPSFKGKSYILFNELPLEIFGNRLPEISCEVQESLQPPLTSVLVDICKRSGIAESDIDVSQITGNIDGFIVPNNGETYRDLLEELGQIYFFYAYQEGQKIKFRHYQRPGTITTIPVGDLATREGNSQKPDNYLQRKRFGSELPSNVALTFNNRYANYEQDTQNAFRSTNIESLQRIHQNDEKVQTNASLSRTEAFLSAHRILHQIWATRVTYENITLPPKWLNALAPGEVVALPTGNNPYTLIPIQITDIEIGANLIIAIKGQLYDGNIPSQTLEVTIDESVNTNEEVFSNNWAGAGIPVLLDIAGVKTTDYVGYIGVYSDTPEYTSADVFVSDDNINYNLLTSVTNQITLGNTIGTLLGINTSEIIDNKNTLTVTLNKSINSITDLDFYNHVNLILVGNEIIAFKNAVLIATNTYELSFFIRGLYNTEEYINNHESNESVYILNNELQASPNLKPNTLQYYKALSGYDDIELTNSISATWSFKSAECYTVAHLKSYLYTDKFKVIWKRRTRGETNFENETPLNESMESYAVTFGVPAKNFSKTVTISTNEFSYTTDNAKDDGILTIESLLDDNNLTIQNDSNNDIDIDYLPFAFDFFFGVAQISDLVGYSTFKYFTFTWQGELLNTFIAPYIESLVVSINATSSSSTDTILYVSGRINTYPVNLTLRLNNIDYHWVVNEATPIDNEYEWTDYFSLREPLTSGIYLMTITAMLYSQSPVLSATNSNLLTVI